MRGADFAERFLALFERLVVAVESIAASIVNRKVLPAATMAPSALHAFQPEAASGERVTQVLASDERRKAKQREAMRALRAIRKRERSLSVPTNVSVLRDAGEGPRDITNRSDGDGCEITNHHAAGDGCDVTSVTCDFTVGGGGGVFHGRSEEISPVFPPKEARRDLNARASGDITGDAPVTRVMPQVTSHVIPKSTVPPRAPLARTARSPTDDGCFGMAVSAWVEGVMSVTGKDYLSPQGSELNLLLALIERRPAEERIDWAREQGVAFARSGPHKLNVFTFKDFVQTPAINRVQPAPTQGDRSWSTRRKKEAT